MAKETGAKKGGQKGPMKRAGQAKLPSQSVQNVKGGSNVAKNSVTRRAKM